MTIGSDGCVSISGLTESGSRVRIFVQPGPKQGKKSPARDDPIDLAANSYACRRVAVMLSTDPDLILEVFVFAGLERVVRPNSIPAKPRTRVPCRLASDSLRQESKRVCLA